MLILSFSSSCICYQIILNQLLMFFTANEMKTLNIFMVKTFQTLKTFHGFSKPYRLDQDSKGGGIMLYIRKDIPSNLLATDRREPLC